MPEYVSRGGAWVLKETITASQEPKIIVEAPKVEPKIEPKVEPKAVKPETKSKLRGRPRSR